MQIQKKLNLMFMKHYAPNRWGGGGPGGGGGWGGQGGCESRIEVFVQIQKKKIFFWGGGGGGRGERSGGGRGRVGGVRVDVNQELKFFGKFKKN